MSKKQRTLPPTTAVQEITSICSLRTAYEMDCRDCKYYGDYCNQVKEIFKVERPMNIDTFKFKALFKGGK